ncbi:MAG: glutamine-hydrolyzing carbamoyl-phosphate synthase small subunit [bacterium]|nr:glutamine-hydrolyzing carbamoyl-phosphate synthase small subunit [bacterium]
MIRAGALVLSDGEVFEGEIIGADPPNGIVSGEVVFNTVLSGYQEVITDPSYAGQIITFTYPHIGNYGVTPADCESRKPFCRGVIVRDLARRSSNWRASSDLATFCRQNQITGLAGVDTRRLTNHIRSAGAMCGAFGTASETDLRVASLTEPGTTGIDLVATVTRTQPEHFASTRADNRPPHRVVALDLGIKSTIVHHLCGIAEVEVVPASTSAPEILARKPDGVFLSNGPGDPTAVADVTHTIANLLGEVPIFGICLGHQLLANTLGAEIFKLRFGHHGGNHPVRNLATGTVEITSQNHNFCVADSAIAGADITHINLNDHTVEGLVCKDIAAFSVQYHPEAGPGPHDSRYLFAQFDELMSRNDA